jgi:plastocyanin
MTRILVDPVILSFRFRRAIAAVLVCVAANTFVPGVPAAARASNPPGATISGNVMVTKADTPEEAVRRFTLLNRYAVSKATKMEQNMGSSQAARPLSEKAIVYLESDRLGKQKYPVPAKHPTLDQKDMIFHPRVLPVLVGTTVDFPNKDAIFHNVFSYSGPKEFDLGRYPKGDSRSVRFDAEGIIRVYCDIHAHMNATIIVFDHPYFAVPDDEGNYSIPNVPDGEYTANFWYDRDVVAQKRISVRNGAAVTLNFQY